LLEAVLADPADDAARAVYGDHLHALGDPRGEFIALQLRHAAGDATDASERRERELLRRHRKEWLGPLTAVVNSSLVSGTLFSRGFLDQAALLVAAPKRWTPELLGHPSWATVTRLYGPSHVPGSHLQLLAHAPLRALLVEDEQMTAAYVQAIAYRTEPLRSLRRIRVHREDCISNDCLHLLYDAVGFASVKELELSIREPGPRDLEEVMRSRLAVGLESLEILPRGSVDGVELVAAQHRQRATIDWLVAQRVSVPCVMLGTPDLRGCVESVVARALGDRYVVTDEWSPIEGRTRRAGS